MTRSPSLPANSALFLLSSTTFCVVASLYAVLFYTVLSIVPFFIHSCGSPPRVSRRHLIAILSAIATWIMQSVESIVSEVYNIELNHRFVLSDHVPMSGMETHSVVVPPDALDAPKRRIQ